MENTMQATNDFDQKVDRVADAIKTGHEISANLVRVAKNNVLEFGRSAAEKLNQVVDKVEEQVSSQVEIAKEGFSAREENATNTLSAFAEANAFTAVEEINREKILANAQDTIDIMQESDFDTPLEEDVKILNAKTENELKAKSKAIKAPFTAAAKQTKILTEGFENDKRIVNETQLKHLKAAGIDVDKITCAIVDKVEDVKTDVTQGIVSTKENIAQGIDNAEKAIKVTTANQLEKVSQKAHIMSQKLQ